MSKALRQRKADTVSSIRSAESAKGETIITDGATIMAAIKSCKLNSSEASEVKAHKERLTSLEWMTSLQVLELTVASLRNEITALQAKCTDLECHSRRSNLRLVGIPEGVEGTQPTKLIAEVLQEIIRGNGGRRLSYVFTDLTSRRTFFGGHSSQTAQIQRQNCLHFP